MLSKINIGKYYQDETVIHSINPVVKLLSTILYIALLFLSTNIYEIIVLFLLLIIIFELAKLPRVIYLKTFLGLKYIFLFLIIIYLVLGEEYTYIVVVISRLYLLVLYTTVVTYTTSPSSLMCGLSVILSPLNLLKIPVNKLAFSLSLALRFIPTIIEQCDKVMKSQASRGVDYRVSDIKGKILSLRTLLVPVFLLTMKKADNLADAMQIRQYNIDFKRNYFKEICWKLRDFIYISIYIIILVVTVLVI